MIEKALLCWPSTKGEERNENITIILNVIFKNNDAQCFNHMLAGEK
jgi:hypothetical protein